MTVKDQGMVLFKLTCLHPRWEVMSQYWANLTGKSRRMKPTMYMYKPHACRHIPATVIRDSHYFQIFLVTNFL